VKQNLSSSDVKKSFNQNLAVETNNPIVVING